MPSKKKPTPRELYKRQWNRINRIVREYEQQGYKVDKGFLPSYEEKLTSASTKNLKKITPKEIRKHTYSPEFGGTRTVAQIEEEKWQQNFEKKQKQRIAKEKQRREEASKRAKSQWNRRMHPERYAVEFEMSLENLGTPINTPKQNRRKRQQYNTSDGLTLKPYGKIEDNGTKFVPIEEVGLKRTDIWGGGWKPLKEEELPKGIDKYFARRAALEFYDVRSGNELGLPAGWYVKKSLPSVKGNVLEALDNLLPRSDYYTSSRSSSSWLEYTHNNMKRIESLINGIRNAPPEKQAQLIKNIEDNVGEIYETMYGMLYKYEDFQKSNDNFGKLFKLITGNTMDAESALKINDYESSELFLDEEEYEEY